MASWGKRLVGMFLGGKGTGARKMARPGRTRRATLEALEDRQLLSVSGSIEAVATSGVFLSGEAIADTGSCAEAVSAADMDGDGDLDVLCAFSSNDTVLWYENRGSQGFDSHTVTNTDGEPCSLATADLDGDGDTDVLVAGRDSDTISWYENDGSGQFTAHLITSDADGASSVYAADVDGDGDVDVLSASAQDDHDCLV